MSPIVHGRIYPETDSSELLGYKLRVLIDPRAVQEHPRAILDIDTLRLYLRTIESPCEILLLLPARGAEQTASAAYELMHRIGATELVSSIVIAPDAAAAFPDLSGNSEILTFASTASFADVDIAVSDQLFGQADTVAGFRRLHIELISTDRAKQACEVFVRGHEVPWSFRLPAWLMPWTPFYTMVDPDIQKMEEFRGLATRKGVSGEGQERIRSVALNRWSAIAYTRDKLFFYMIQRRRAQRHKREKQGFTFELSYHLTMYSLLFWGALDQLCWIVNDLCALAFKHDDWRDVGVEKRRFLARLAERDSKMLAIFQDSEFLRWVDVLRRSRHYVAHQGTAMLSPLFEKAEPEKSQAEIDQEVEDTAEWRELSSRWSPAMMETFRPNLRAKWFMKHHRQISDAAFVLQNPTEAAIIFPLQNIAWEYERFRTFALAVAERCSAILHARAD